MSDTFAKTIFKVLLFLAIFELLVIAGRFVYLPVPSGTKGIVVGGVLTLYLYFATRMFVAKEATTLADVGMVPDGRSPIRLAISLVAGMLFFGFFYLVYLGFAPVAASPVEKPDWLEAVLLSVLTFLLLSAMEEFAFRGYALQKLKDALGIRLSIYFTAIAFGLYHGLTIDSLLGPAVWGLMYGVLALWSRGLAVPIGFHAGANLIQALFSQKEKWVSGIWTLDLADKLALFSVEQITLGLQVLLLVASVILVEVYIARAAK